MTDSSQVFNNPFLIARHVSAEEYMERYAADHTEWVQGDVIPLSPIHDRHYLIDTYITHLFSAYFSLNPIGQLRGEPFVMRLDEVPSRREPDLQVILGDNQNNLTPTYMHGPADICVEVVSPESAQRDYVDKLKEYESAGVCEYWIIDPTRNQATFYRPDEDSHYQIVAYDGVYTSPLLPCFELNVPTLWQGNLPDVIKSVAMVQAMLADCDPSAVQVDNE
jgi:Uma2 family endonuclease